MRVVSVKALEDNYIWVWTLEDRCVVVDPGEAQPVIDYIQAKDLSLEAVLLTHAHADHVEGVEALLAACGQVPVYGPRECQAWANQLVEPGDRIQVLDQELSVHLTAGHTSGHISYLGPEAVFCGDALFSAGCGRVFTQDYQSQYAAMEWFRSLPDSVAVYGAHEYTETNLRFALSEDPDNPQLQEALDQVLALRQKGLPTLPSTIRREKAINPLMMAEDLEAFKALRLRRDKF